MTQLLDQSANYAIDKLRVTPVTSRGTFYRLRHEGSPAGAGGTGGPHLAEAVPVLGAAHARLYGKAADKLPVGKHEPRGSPVPAVVVELRRHGDVRPDLRGQSG
eukprot:9199232-Pyramimonas_sp.AAC.1